MLAIGTSGKLPTASRSLGATAKPTDAIISNTHPTKVTMPTSEAVLSGLQDTQHRHIWIVTGPAGCGKTTVATWLAGELGMQYLEGDDFHPASNRQKMSQNIPLTDVDRWDWLISLRDAAVTTQRNSPTTAGVVVTCSALKRKYRDVIRVAAYNDHDVRVHFLYLHASEQELLRRVEARKGHYMGVAMVRSQFESLEEPGLQEAKDVIACDCSGDIEEVSRVVLAKVQAELEADHEGRGLADGW